MVSDTLPKAFRRARQLSAKLLPFRVSDHVIVGPLKGENLGGHVFELTTEVEAGDEIETVRERADRR